MALQTVAQLADKSDETALEVRTQFGDRYDGYYMMATSGEDDDEELPVAENMQGERKTVQVLAFFGAEGGTQFYEHDCKVVVDVDGNVWVDGEDEFTEKFL